MISKNNKLPCLNQNYFHKELFLPIKNQDIKSIQDILTFIFSHKKVKSYFMENLYVKFLHATCNSPIALPIIQKLIDINQYSISEFSIFLSLISYELPVTHLQKILNDFYYTHTQQDWFKQHNSKSYNYTICSAFVHHSSTNCYPLLKDLKLIDDLPLKSYSSLITYCFNYNNLDFLDSLLSDKRKLLFKTFIGAVLSYYKSDAYNLYILPFFYSFCSDMNQKEFITLNKIINQHYDNLDQNSSNHHMLKNIEEIKNEISKLSLHQKLLTDLPSSCLTNKVKI